MAARDLPGIWRRKGWRRVVAILGAAYCLVAWAFPVVVMLVVRELPYLQERGFPERLALSAIGSAALVAAMVASFPERLRIYRGSTPWDTAKNGLLALSGLAMFTVLAALWSANLFGALAKALPGSGYSARMIVTGVDHGGMRARTVSLTLRPAEGTKVLHLALSKRLFDVPGIEAGDEVILNGKRGPAGTYIDGLRVISRTYQRQLPSPNSLAMSGTTASRPMSL